MRQWYHIEFKTGSEFYAPETKVSEIKDFWKSKTNRIESIALATTSMRGIEVKGENMLNADMHV